MRAATFALESTRLLVAELSSDGWSTFSAFLSRKAPTSNKTNPVSAPCWRKNVPIFVSRKYLLGMIYGLSGVILFPQLGHQMIILLL